MVLYYYVDMLKDSATRFVKISSLWKILKSLAILWVYLVLGTIFSLPTNIANF